MNEKIELAQHKFMEGVGRMSNTFGLNKFVAQLYTLLYLKAIPLSLDEMAELLGVTKGNVSINIRELEKWGAVKNIWVKGSRKDFYEADPDLKKVFLSKIRSAVQKRTTELSALIDEFERVIESLNGNLANSDAEIVARYAKRLNNIKEIKALAITALAFSEQLTA